MIEQADGVERERTISCDVCIVGAGAAGITLAAELAGSPLDVVLLESGGEQREEPTQALYRGELSGAPQFPLDISRLRFLGGTTNHWAGTCRPFDDFDFEERSWVPHSGWPIGRSDLDAYYERAHAVCDLGPYDYGEKSWPGVTDPGPLLAGHRDVVLKMVQNSKPTRWARKYAPLLGARAGPRVILHANACEIVPDASGRTIERIDVRTLAGNRFSVAARAHVLATGGIENARLLLLSDSVVPSGLGNAHGLVGRFFMDHPGAIPLGALLFFDERVQRQLSDRVLYGVGVRAGMSVGRETQQRMRLLNHVVYTGRPATLEQVRDFEWFNIVQVVKDTLDTEDLGIARFLQSLDPAREGARATLCWVRAEQAPNPDSRVTLGEERDALGLRRVALDWRLSEINQHTFVEAASLYSRIVARSGAGRMKVMPWPLERDPQWWKKITPGWHHMGTTRMAADPRAGVVDSDCRVFGLDNLYVAGSSVFPTSSYINPTLTLVALAIRLADHLREKLPAG